MNRNLDEILKLSISERILIVEAIWDSIAAENREYKITDEELNILEERYEEYKANPSDVLTWDEVKKNILKKM